MRREYDSIVRRLIAKAEQDGDLDDREDILALMLQARYDDGTPMSHRDSADQLLALLTAGHETTATTLAWTVERLRRHPDVLNALVEEVDAGGKTLREATILETQRARPVIDIVGRKIRADSFQLGRWTVPKGMVVLVSIALMHEDPKLFPNPDRFDPSRFVDAKPDLYQWIPFGGGTRRCIGAAFANMEMTVTLRTLLREFEFGTTYAAGERIHSRGVATAPAHGGRAVQADLIASHRTDQGIRDRNRADSSRAAVAPGRCASVRLASVVPVRTGDHVVAVAEHRQYVEADRISCDRADQGIRRRHLADGSRAAVTPSHGAGVGGIAVVPERTADDVVAVAQGHNKRADLIFRRRPDHGVVDRHRTADACPAAPETPWPRDCIFAL